MLKLATVVVVALASLALAEPEITLGTTLTVTVQGGTAAAKPFLKISPLGLTPADSIQFTISTTANVATILFHSNNGTGTTAGDLVGTGCPASSFGPAPCVRTIGACPLTDTTQFPLGIIAVELPAPNRATQTNSYNVTAIKLSATSSALAVNTLYHGTTASTNDLHIEAVTITAADLAGGAATVSLVVVNATGTAFTSGAVYIGANFQPGTTAGCYNLTCTAGRYAGNNVTCNTGFAGGPPLINATGTWYILWAPAATTTDYYLQVNTAPVQTTTGSTTGVPTTTGVSSSTTGVPGTTGVNPTTTGMGTTTGSTTGVSSTTGQPPVTTTGLPPVTTTGLPPVTTTGLPPITTTGIPSTTGQPPATTGTPTSTTSSTTAASTTSTSSSAHVTTGPSTTSSASGVVASLLSVVVALAAVLAL
jgi:hypothetical protein